MGYDKTVNIKKHESDLTIVADAILEVTKSTESIDFPQGYIDTLSSLVNKNDTIAKYENKEVVELVNNQMIKNVPPAFQKGNKKLIKVSLPKVPSMSNECFGTCSYLVDVNLPLVKSMGAGSFSSCARLPKIYMPSLETISSYGYNFNVCSKLEKAYFPKLTNLTSADFAGCTILETLILGSDMVCTLAATNIFQNSPIAKGTGYVYVPKALVEDYKVATNWSTYAAQIRAIEDYPEVLEGWE